MAPYQENNNGDCPEAFLEFNDTEDDIRKKYDNGLQKCVKLPDGKVVSYYDNIFYGGRKIDRDALESSEIPNKTFYKTFEEFVEKTDGCVRDPKTGRYGYWSNPNAKWDYYQVGGRWTGYFKLKCTASMDLPEHGIGKSGLFTEPARLGYADSVQKKHIDIIAMRTEAAEKASKQWDKIHDCVGDSIESFIPWTKFVEQVDNKEIEMEEARALYHNQEANKKLKEMKEFFLELEDYLGTKEDYVKDVKNRVLVPYVVVKDCKWYEKGEMGWFGMSSNEKDQDEWNEEFTKLFDSLDDDAWLTAVDCHI